MFVSFIARAEDVLPICFAKSTISGLRECIFPNTSGSTKLKATSNCLRDQSVLVGISISNIGRVGQSLSHHHQQRQTTVSSHELLVEL